MHINSRDRQIKLAPAVGFEPTIRLRRISSQASIGVLQNAHEECIQSSKLAPAVGFEPTTNRLTADRSTTELRWIFFLRDYGAWILRCAIFGGKSFLAHKIAAETSGRAGNRSLLKNLVAGAALKIFGDQLAYKSRFLLFAF